MDAAGVIRLAIMTSMGLLVLALGMRESFADAFFLFRRPGLLARSLAAMNLIAPILVIWLMAMLDLRPAIEVALVALSLSPVPPVLPKKQLKLVHAEGFAIGLLVAASVCAIIVIPVAEALLRQLGYNAGYLRGTVVLRIVAMSVLLPLLLGMAIRALWPVAAERSYAAISNVATAILVVAIIPVLIAQWPVMRSFIGDGTLLAIAVATVLWLIVGHVLGGPAQENRSVLALATASRHPGVAVAVASAAFPDRNLVVAGVLLAFLVSTVVSVPYVIWRKRVLSHMDHPAAPTPHGVH